MKKILITGGGGFIGTSLITSFSNNIDCDIISYSTHHSKTKFGNKAVYIEGNILDEEKLNKVMKGVDIVIHLAGGGGEAHCLTDPVNSVLVNVLGTELILKYAKIWDIEQLIFASSIYSYSSYKKITTPIKEKDKQCPDAFYGSLKLVCEEIIRNSGIDHVICRFSNVYGVGSGIHFISGALGNFVDAVINKSKIFIFGEGQNLMDYLHIDDATTAITTLLKNNVKNKVYNFGGGSPISVYELAKSIVKQANKIGIPYDHKLVNKQGDEKVLADLWLDINKAKKELNWKPSININDGIANMIKYLRKLQ